MTTPYPCPCGSTGRLHTLERYLPRWGIVELHVTIRCRGCGWQTGVYAKQSEAERDWKEHATTEDTNATRP